jgi:catechol-2,3-dioxygenase
MTPSKWLQDNLADVLVAVAQAQATLAGQTPTVASQAVAVEDPNA